MIITLKNADFSLSNIGNIYRWPIKYNIGNGVSHSGPTSVLKDGSYSVTFTVISEFELAEAGVTVTVDGQLLSDAVTISENTIVVEISKVTGPVVINIPTVATIVNLLDLSTMSSSLRYSPGNYTIVGSSATKYGLFTKQLEPSSTYYLKIDSGYTGGLFVTEPIKGEKTTQELNIAASGKGTHTINTTADACWIALNIATTAVWQSALLYKAE